MLAEYDPLMIDNWLVIGSVANQSVIKKLISTGRRVSVASPKLGGRQLAHVASLAALGQPTCATDDCASCRPRDANKLDEAALDEDQWLLMRCLAEGLSNKEIARLQTTSEGAVKARVRALLSRLGATNRTQAAVIGARAGLRLERTAPKQQLVFDTPPERARTFFALVS
jgi:DNA-binding NarL/FixJ family response regulator